MSRQPAALSTAALVLPVAAQVAPLGASTPEQVIGKEEEG